MGSVITNQVFEVWELVGKSLEGSSKKGDPSLVTSDEQSAGWGRRMEGPAEKARQCLPWESRKGLISTKAVGEAHYDTDGRIHR